LSDLSVEYIFDIFTERLQQEGIWFILALRDNKPLLKEQLKDEVNRIYMKNIKPSQSQSKPLVTSRYVLDRYTALLEGAGLVNVEEIGKARMYSLSELGRKFIEYTRQKRQIETR
jgi:DNA-binding PadR family transcriptional regulator